MEFGFNASEHVNSNIILSDTFFYKLPSTFKREDLMKADMIILASQHPGGYKLGTKILDENGNLIIKVSVS
ncbi:hypothetical protein SAMN04487969_101136 [Paenibacillus algorifonticola]|uniref:Uncharacterized protein n=1 Tax=Paenibacillus algorifonticola TaxID=684063 RepID=A0A1I1XWE1_9BACL|nr:hypothetical protein [Paenibacillus algorifonticola]SFE11591.1 hypothetical protein SAMN04487969_101136 [Paenibacillus algorifonticola]